MAPRSPRSLSPGQRLSQRFYRHVVLPRVTSVIDPAPHAAALMGDGSEVLGFDDSVSTDHDFGPRLTLLLPVDMDPNPVLSALQSLPVNFEGFPTAYSDRDSHAGAIAHHVEVTTTSKFFTHQLGYDPADGMTLARWLLTPTYALAALTAGAVFADQGGELKHRRDLLQWYPDDVWRYVLAAGWLRVSHKAAFIGRAGAAGDDLGSTLVTARVARDLVRLAFLVERRWAPYSKWLGRAFTELPLPAQLKEALEHCMRATSWRQREAALCKAASTLVAATNRLELAPPVDPTPRRFHNRDINVVAAEELAGNLTAAIDDRELRDLIENWGIRADGVRHLPGAIDQVIDSVDVLTSPERRLGTAAALGLALR